jgi:hypothetical protein
MKFRQIMKAVFTACGIALVGAMPLASAATVLLNYTFGVSYAPNGLITNEYAYWNPSASDAWKSSYWQMDSGSLFRKTDTNVGYTGKIDDCSGYSNGPNATSSNCTDSAVFRLNTINRTYNNVRVDMRLYQLGLASTPSTPAVDWDGVHIFLRYQSEYNLYYASVNRRDGHVVIKKKCAGGSSNGGTYYTLAEKSGYAIPYNTWQNVGATVQTVAPGKVTINLLRNGAQVLTATDSGTGCSAITNAGATGVRGDNDRFYFDDFVVTSL